MTETAPQVPVPAMPSSATQPIATDQKKAEWLWKLANGSLLLPILLSLIVLYFAMGMLQNLEKSRQVMMQPIFEHQLKLLEEDRRRLFQKPE